MSTTRPARKSSLSATSTTTVFTSGNSQAVRLPKAFRVSAKTLEISKRGDEIVLREQPRTVGALMADLPVLSDSEAEVFDRAMRNTKAGLGAIEERDYSWMERNPFAKAKRPASKQPAKKRA
jgi:antitoxin VapB